MNFCNTHLYHTISEYKLKLPRELTLIFDPFHTGSITENENFDGSTKIQMEISKREKLTNYIDLGKDLRAMVNIINKTLGKFVVLDISMCLLVTIITVYFIPLIFDAWSRTQDNEITLNPVKLSFGIHCFFLALKAGIRWINYYRAGQHTSNEFQKVKSTLEELLIDFHDDLQKVDRSKLKILIGQFDSNAPYQPMASFNLTLPTAVSAAGLVATYLVILVQFKQSNLQMQTNRIFENYTDAE